MNNQPQKEKICHKNYIWPTKTKTITLRPFEGEIYWFPETMGKSQQSLVRDAWEGKPEESQEKWAHGSNWRYCSEWLARPSRCSAQQSTGQWGMCDLGRRPEMTKVRAQEGILGKECSGKETICRDKYWLGNSVLIWSDRGGIWAQGLAKCQVRWSF